MTFSKKLNTHVKSEINTGFGINSGDYGGRFLNKNGEANIEKRGIGILARTSWYHTMLAWPRAKFFFVIFLFFVAANLAFACLYDLVGVDHLNGIVYQSRLDKFIEAFFFSCQTFTTVGYGRVNPVGFLTSGIAAFESLIGLLAFALVTGLLYGRFSKPKAYLKFSQNAMLAPYKDHLAIMLRVAPYKNNTLVDAEAKVTLGLTIEEDGKMINKFFQLPLEFDKVNTLTLSWTMVHPITEDSPLYKFTPEDFASMRGEFLVFLKAFDDVFSNTVVARTSYTFKELIHGGKFEPMYHRSSEGNKTVLHLDKLNHHILTDISKRFKDPATETS